jgi:hypothetical protein
LQPNAADGLFAKRSKSIRLAAEMNGSLRVGDLDSLFLKPFQDPVPELMLD